jgi:hypothetical protein
MGHFKDCEYISIDTDVLEGDMNAVNIMGKEFTREQVFEDEDLFEVFKVCYTMYITGKEINYSYNTAPHGRRITLSVSS